ncbi:MAG: hypothetical protein AAGF71_13850 [Pseudomonadota bacterium]
MADFATRHRDADVAQTGGRPCPVLNRPRDGAGPGTSKLAVRDLSRPRSAQIFIARGRMSADK